MDDVDGKRILIDVDGTLCLHLPRLCEFLEIAYGIEHPPEAITDWSYNFESAGVGIDEVITRLFDERAEWFLADLDPVPGGQAALDALSAAGHEIWIVTHRPAETHDLTRTWLAEQDISYDRYVADVPENKAAVGGDILIDDYHGHVADAVAAGMTGYAFDRPYTEPVAHDRAYTVSTWDDVLDQVGVVDGMAESR